MNVAYYKSPIGVLEIKEDSKGISSIQVCSNADFEKENSTPLLNEAVKQLDEYFNKTRKVFDLPLSLKGTDFQLKVWNELLNIPYGETKSYSEIAKAIKSLKASRAVGMANNKNPLIILIPCHRVIGKSGALTGYAAGLEAKKFLLNLEGGI